MLGQTAIEERIVYIMVKISKQDCVTIEEAVRDAGLSRPALYTYLNVMGIQRHKFPYDRKTYILRADVDRIKEFIQENKAE